MKTQKKRPAQTGELVGTRFQPDLLHKIDSWRATLPDIPTRPEAIRRIVQVGLTEPSALPAPKPVDPPVMEEHPPHAIPAELVTAIERCRASRPFLETFDDAVSYLLEQGLDALNPPDELVILDHETYQAVRTFANGMDTADAVERLLLQALAGWRAEMSAIKELRKSGHL